MYLILLFISADILILFGRITNIIQNFTLSNIRFYSGLAVVLLTAGIVTYGLINANQIKITEYKIELNNASLNDLRIILISDTHLGDVNSERNLERMVQSINSLKPDIVCIAGDIFNDNFNLIRNPDRAVSLFRNIDSTYGVFACLGNHDGGQTLRQMKNFMEESNIKLLNDEYVIVDERFALFGRLDASPIGGFGDLQRQDISQTIASVGANMPVIVMEHNPSHIKEYSQQGRGREADLILAGHTHSGQMFPGNLITRAMFVVDHGHYQKDAYSPHVIVTSGVSTWRPPMRIGTNNEIVSILVR
ncbi:MAG: metallophosphoesterase [Treponema sp.]|nr:metallophosphoesterase [Treponema sp.]